MHFPVWKAFTERSTPVISVELDELPQGEHVCQSIHIRKQTITPLVPAPLSRPFPCSCSLHQNDRCTDFWERSLVLPVTELCINHQLLSWRIMSANVMLCVLQFICFHCYIAFYLWRNHKLFFHFPRWTSKMMDTWVLSSLGLL